MIELIIAGILIAVFTFFIAYSISRSNSTAMIYAFLIFLALFINSILLSGEIKFILILLTIGSLLANIVLAIVTGLIHALRSKEMSN